MNKLEFFEKNSLACTRLQRLLGSSGTHTLDGRWSYGTCLSYAHKSARNQNYNYLYKRVAGFKITARNSGTHMVILKMDTYNELKEKFIEDLSSLMSHVLVKSLQYTSLELYNLEHELTTGCFLDFLHPAKKEMRCLYPYGIKMMCFLDSQIRRHLFEEMLKVKAYDDIVRTVSHVYDMQRIEDEKC